VFVHSSASAFLLLSPSCHLTPLPTLCCRPAAAWLYMQTGLVDLDKLLPPCC
jgi:hypothetical protein